MYRLSIACIATLFASVVLAAAGAQEPEVKAERLAELLPEPRSEWSSTGAKTTVVPSGPTKGASAFKIYQKGAKTVIVRLTENPPNLVVRILERPDDFDYEETRHDSRTAVVRERSAQGTMLVPVDKMLVSVDWSGEANRDEAIRYLRAVDLRQLAKLAVDEE